jgi:hypothetical protein
MRKSTVISLILSGLLTTSALSIAPALAAPTGNFKAFWAVQISPNPSGNGGFGAVDCTGARACVAVGSYFNPSANAQLPLAASWDGTAWGVQPIAAPAETDTSDLHGVSCVKRTFCAAVGSDVLTSKRWITLAEVWRGVRWEITPTPPLTSLEFNSLNAVSCSSPADCMAVGSAGDQLLIERWQGASWTIQRAPTPAGSTSSLLYGVSCVTRKWCMAAGYYLSPSAGVLAFTEVWTGKHWSIRPAEQIPGKASQLVGVSCTSKVRCTAVGTIGDLVSVNSPLAERWNGKVWTIQSVPQPTGQPDNALTGVGCSSAHACTAVGVYFTATGPIFTFAESWNGRAWVLQSTVNPSKTSNSLLGVACTSARACTAVGLYAGPESVALSLIERYSVGRCPDRGGLTARWSCSHNASPDRAPARLP